MPHTSIRRGAGRAQQSAIFIGGLAGKRPTVPSSPEALELAAKNRLSAPAFAYLAGGAGSESTIQANRQGFDNWQIVPRMLRDVSACDTSIDLMGTRLPSPFLLAPIGVLELADADADRAVARAAASTGTPMVFSNQASVAMEPCAAEMADSPRWFQLYWSQSDELVASFLQRAVAVGCSAVVLTLDTTMLGWRHRDIDLGYLPFLRGKGLAQYVTDPVFQALAAAQPTVRPDQGVTFASILAVLSLARRYPGGFIDNLKSGLPLKAVRQFIETYSRPQLTWADLPRLKKMTDLPIILKGILHEDDARRAVDTGVNGIIVSNHGGRQVDGAIASVDALPAVVRAVDGRIPVLIDSGIRGGSDVFKALALGAQATLIGRPYAYGLAIDGQAGVETVIRNFQADFDLTMGLAGCRSVDEIGPENLRRR